MTEKNLINTDNILNAEIIEEPWEHAVIDNIIDMPFLWENLSNLLNVLSENKDKILEKYGRYRNQGEKTWITWGLPIQTSGTEYRIHNDNPSKVWSSSGAQIIPFHPTRSWHGIPTDTSIRSL